DAARGRARGPAPVRRADGSTPSGPPLGGGQRGGRRRRDRPTGPPRLGDPPGRGLGRGAPDPARRALGGDPPLRQRDHASPRRRGGPGSGGRLLLGGDRQHRESARHRPAGQAAHRLRGRGGGDAPARAGAGRRRRRLAAPPHLLHPALRPPPLCGGHDAGDARLPRGGTGRPRLRLLRVHGRYDLPGLRRHRGRRRPAAGRARPRAPLVHLQHRHPRARGHPLLRSSHL
ncbi:MAG: hypothetical protein AVDCRST_MAG49-856, partial [uncultured Thermomicrobiales bacterium]